jgi:gluconokinase
MEDGLMPTASKGTPLGLVVMGVSGSGKSTIADRLARRLGWSVADADDLHPQANIDKMSAGIPLTDADREPWLHATRDWLDGEAAAGRNAVITCSALKRSYRDVLRQARSRVRFVFLDGDREVIGQRLAHRAGHFMPTSLLDSQFRDLQPLAADEDGVAVDITGTPAQITEAALRRLGLVPA